MKSGLPGHHVPTAAPGGIAIVAKRARVAKARREEKEKAESKEERL